MEGGKDGGIDLVLRKDGRTELVQCKQWKTRQVNVSTVREMWGLVTHQNADAVKIVCVGMFTADAKEFAEGKAIELISGERLLELVRAVQTVASISSKEPPQSASKRAIDVSPTCARCGAEMVKRTNRQTAQTFWSCSKYPSCKGTQPI